MEYVIQENVFKEQHYDMLFKTLDRLNLKYTTVRCFPYVDKVVDLEYINKNYPDSNYNVDDLPDFEPKTKNVFCFGSLKLSRVSAEKGWYPGSLMNEKHDYEFYKNYFQNELLNEDSEIFSLKDNDKIIWKQYETKFIRPTKDTKAFTGKVYTKNEWDDLLENYFHNYRSVVFNDDTKIQVATHKNIQKEIRFWVLDGKIITGSQYMIGNAVQYSDDIEQEAYEYAQRMVDIYQIAKAFVIDICLTENGWKIVEFNCINCAGFYKCNLQKLIIEIDNYYSDFKTQVTTIIRRTFQELSMMKIYDDNNKTKITDDELYQLLLDTNTIDNNSTEQYKQEMIKAYRIVENEKYGK